MRAHEPEQPRPCPGMGHRKARKSVDPKPPPVKSGMRSRVLAQRPCEDLAGGQNSRPQGIIDPLAGERLDHARRISHVKHSIPVRSNGRAPEWGYGPPGLAVQY